MYKLVVSSFDKTLIDDEEAISASTVMTIDRIRKNSVLFAVTTSRSLQEILNYNRDFSFIDYIICFNGAYLYDAKKKKSIIKQEIKQSVIKKIITVFKDYKIYAYKEDDTYLLNETTLKKIYQLELECPSKKEQLDVSKKLDELNLDITIIKRVNEDKFYVALIMNNISKTICLEKLATINNITPKEIVSISANEEDIPLLKFSGLSVSMKNASSKIKKITNKITDTNNDKGLKNILNQLFPDK